jgi:hypothetical protein
VKEIENKIAVDICRLECDEQRGQWSPVLPSASCFVATLAGCVRMRVAACCAH